MAAVVAMMFLALLSTLAVAMYSTATMNVQTSRNYADQQKARSAAESGLRWVSWRFVRMARPRTTVGNITPAAATSLWPAIRSAVAADFANMATASERPLTTDGATVRSNPIAVDETPARFVVSMRPHPLDASDPLDARHVRVPSTGTFGRATHAVSMSFRIDKKVKFAIVGKVPIQIGRNTIVEGPMGMSTPNKYPPFLLLSDFRHLTAGLRNRIDAFQNFVAANHNGYANRISVHNPGEFGRARDAGHQDWNGDFFVDEYDVFLREFDSDNNGAITGAEFTNPATGRMYDADLFAAIDALGAPQSGGESPRAGYMDGKIGFSKDAVLTATNSYGFTDGNNLRFNNCTMRGPVVADNPTAYTHFGNSWEFTGATLFDNRADDTATIVAPQTNIEMGSFTAPGSAPSTLVGVVVAGNIDIRGKSVVDGSIIVTGDGAGNTTQGWFGPSDSSTEASTEMPEGGFGRLNVRYNPNRALPDGINVPIDILPDTGTYAEGPQ